MPVPSHRPASHAVFAGQSQSSSHGQYDVPPADVHIDVKYAEPPQVNRVCSPLPSAAHTWTSPAEVHVVSPAMHTSATHCVPSQNSVAAHSIESVQRLSWHTKPEPLGAGMHRSVAAHINSAHVVGTQAPLPSATAQCSPAMQ
jgi:hypothetical protein